MASREAQIRNILTKKFPELFEQEVLEKLSIKKDPRGRRFWVPEQLDIKDSSKGLSLRGGVGCIRITETVNEKGEVISYIYKFSSNEYLFTTVRTESDEKPDECRLFDFHYDKEEGDKPYGPHLSVVYPSLRYLSRHIELEEFLTFIREHLFESVGGKLKKRSSCIWTNRI